MTATLLSIQLPRMINVSPRWRMLFWAAAAYNFLIGIPGIFTATNSSERIVSLLVACFSLVYAFVAREPLRFAPMLWAGVAGKIGVIAILLPEVMSGTGRAGLAPILAGDAFFVVGFLWFLLKR